VGAIIAITGYYITYEYIHWCMHLPKQRRVEKPWVFRRLNGHHLLHHRYMHKNFNVVCPLADFCLGTLMVRSKTRFAQATGPSVPCVQPVEA
jgi:sterol desaturase/sphingolipid hydroxylase (fatty acid hydroxylase superfamily)